MSALVAITLQEADAERCYAALERTERALISAGTLGEALIVSRRRRFGREMESLVAAFARRAAAAHDRFGRGVHPAAPIFGDCFAYALARYHDCPLLFAGDGFSQTGITPAA